jgi:CheY-like chemotaxis protein
MNLAMEMLTRQIRSIELTTKAPLRKLSVLVCEYRPYNRAVLTSILAAQGHSVTISPSLTEALAVFAANPKNTFDLIVVDVIPSENQMQWVETVRKKRPDMMLLAISAFLGDGFLPPACGLYLPKPFTSRELVNAIAELSTIRWPARSIPPRRLKHRKAA